MQDARRWAITGLLCLCGAIGCAQLPSRGVFARRTKPPTAQARAEDRIDLGEEDSTSLLRDSQDASLSEDSLTANDAGGLFDVSSRELSTSDTGAVEAPPPIRRSPAAPSPFVAPPNAREISSRPSSETTEIADDPNAVRLANHEADSLESYTGIELAAGQRRTNSGTGIASNPWDRFRGLTSNADTANPSEQGLRELELSRDQTRYDRDSSFDASPPASPLVQGFPQSQPWPQAAQQAVTNDAANSAKSPDPWPRGPANKNPNPAASAPTNVQWINAEQPGHNNFPVPALSPQEPSHAGNLPLHFGLPEGIPLGLAPFSSSPELERLITQTTVEAAAVTPGDNEISRQLYLRKHVQLRLLHLIAGQTDRALQPIPGIDSADQEFWQQMLWGMANYFDTQGMPDSSERATQTISQLRAATSRLQEKARLELHNVAFCHKISGFGNYQRFKRDEFTPGQPVLLYAEVADFKSEPTPDGQFRTLMKSTLEVLEGGPAGRIVETLPLTPSEDRCRNQRRDYYHSYEFAIPQNCNPGPHALRLRVEDQLGKKTAVTTLNFSVQ